MRALHGSILTNAYSKPPLQDEQSPRRPAAGKRSARSMHAQHADRADTSTTCAFALTVLHSALAHSPAWQRGTPGSGAAKQRAVHQAPCPRPPSAAAPQPAEDDLSV